MVPGSYRRGSGEQPEPGRETTRGASPEELRALAERQAAVVRALVAGEAAPPGFDDTALRAAESALLRKRAGILARHNPLLAHAAGPDFEQTFAEWARGRPKVSTEADIAGFAAHLGFRLPSRRGRIGERLRGLLRLRF
ncbi:hypothetical protein [Nocardia cyriacigeorgica]|uniref:hypothetical protein n=1 Tax=Nocardia cyriacigeorgica TaxID=135487 RepID=UPI00158AEFF5|nr:hypothetical protein [Nocardia cyriacigeorgica]MBF6453209.1 hypothetical protein [Nocardia cyriacigeorgica]MBF6481540.1 hypothetical protein [Nocardia cyriacigeorgica]MBF6550378.1 hypothetical protein [Nocardia cyriacigeorgica]